MLNKIIKEFIERNEKIDFSKIKKIEKFVFDINSIEDTIDTSTVKINFDVDDIHYSTINWVSTIIHADGSSETFEDEIDICDYILYDIDLTPKQVSKIIKDIKKQFGKLSVRLNFDIQILKLFNENLSEKSMKIVLKEEKKFQKRETKSLERETKDHEKYMKKFYKTRAKREEKL